MLFKLAREQPAFEVFVCLFVLNFQSITKHIKVLRCWHCRDVPTHVFSISVLISSWTTVDGLCPMDHTLHVTDICMDRCHIPALFSVLGHTCSIVAASLWDQALPVLQAGDLHGGPTVESAIYNPSETAPPLVCRPPAPLRSPPQKILAGLCT